MSRTITYQGWLREREYGDSPGELFLDGASESPFAEVLHERITGKQVSVRYWTTTKECTKDDAEEDFLKRLFGVAETEYMACYSEDTGYLYTTEQCTIGGHDLIQEFWSGIGMWLILEIEIHDEEEEEDWK